MVIWRAAISRIVHQSLRCLNGMSRAAIESGRTGIGTLQRSFTVSPDHVIRPHEPGLPSYVPPWVHRSASSRSDPVRGAPAGRLLAAIRADSQIGRIG